ERCRAPAGPRRTWSSTVAVTGADDEKDAWRQRGIDGARERSRIALGGPRLGRRQLRAGNDVRGLPPEQRVAHERVGAAGEREVSHVETGDAGRYDVPPSRFRTALVWHPVRRRRRGTREGVGELHLCERKRSRPLPLRARHPDRGWLGPPRAR